MNIFIQLCQSIEINNEWKSKDRVLFIGYIFRLIGVSEFTKKMKKRYDIDSATVIQLRKKIDSNGYILLHIKSWMFFCYQNKYNKKQRIKCAKDFGIEDADLILKFASKHQPKLLELSEFTALPLDTYQDHIRQTIMDVDTYTSKFVYRKLRFIYQNVHNSLSHGDIKNDLVYQGIKNILLTYPRIHNRLHALNICKRNVHNHGINLIGYMTRPCRANTVQLENGNFESTLVSYDSTLAKNIDPSNNDPNSIIQKSVPDHSNKILDMLFWKSIITRYQGKDRILLFCILGIYNKEFSNYLLCHPNILQSCRMDNDLLYDRQTRLDNMEKYKGYLLDYLDMDEYNSQIIFDDVKQHFLDEKRLH